MNAKRLWLLILAFIAGCQSLAQGPFPALLESADPAAISTVEQTISTALDGAAITLGANAFSESSLLTLEHAVRQSSKGRLATGRMTEKPEQFRLEISGTNCSLLRVKTGDRVTLAGVRCKRSPSG